MDVSFIRKRAALRCYQLAQGRPAPARQRRQGRRGRTPRRLALIAADLPEQTEAVSEEAKGPPEGAPDAAIDGFCKSELR